jgi:hypothetical protein
VEELAGLVNNLHSKSLGRFEKAKAGSYELDIKNTGSSVAMGIIHLGKTTGTITVSFSEERGVSAITVGFSIMWFVFLVGVVGAVVLGLKRPQQSKGIVRTNPDKQARQLTTGEIMLYFPAVPYSGIFTMSQPRTSVRNS